MENTAGAPAQQSGQRPPRPHFQDGRRGGARRGRGDGHRGRGRGGANSRESREHARQRSDGNKPSEENGIITANGQSRSLQPQGGQPEARSSGNATEDDDSELCPICASAVIHWSRTPCNHRTCHICVLRRRALYKTNACLHCRTAAEYEIFTDHSEKRYEDYVPSDFDQIDNALGIKYQKKEIFEDSVLLLRYNCPDPTCDIACFGWPDLHRHVKVQHGRVMCDLCTRYKKVFTHEQGLFTPAQLRKHERDGDDNPGALDQSGFRGHPECGFCKQRFFGDDELFAHCRDRHERCHICDRRNDSRNNQQQYYLDYNMLELHFSKDHFLCADKECLEKKFVVFESEIDLKAHQLESHPNGLSKDARRDARRVDMSGFDYRSPHQQERGGRRGGEGRGGRGGGRGRDPNADADAPLPASSAQPMRRDELAYQRQLAIHSAQSISNRTFGGQLTSQDAVAARPAPNTSAPATVTAPREGSHTTPLTPNQRPLTTPASDLPEIASLDLSSAPVSVPPPSANLTPSERARYLRHASITERAANLLGHDMRKLSTFRSQISEFKNGNITAGQLIDSFFSLFDCSSSDLGTLVKELADAFEVPDKGEALRRAWNDWRAINEDYPSLPGGTDTGTTSNAGGKRILKLKSSTAKSSRSAAATAAAARPAGWGNVAGAAANSAALGFPSLPSSTAGGAKKSAAWLGAPTSQPTARPSSSARAAPVSQTHPSSAPSSRQHATRADAFPALPATQKLGMSIHRPGYSGSLVKRDGASSPAVANAWANGGSVTSTPVVEEDDPVDGGGKKKGKKKQTLIHWG